jgi:hypothetical protein
MPSLSKWLSALPFTLFFVYTVAHAFFAVWAKERTARNQAEDELNALREISLSVGEPHRQSDHWRVTVHNNSAIIAARNVQVRLVGVTPMPRDPTWSNDFPYIVLRVIDKGESTINPHSVENYDLFSEYQNEREELFIDRLDTKNLGNKIKIETDECWLLSYEVTAENTPRATFSCEINAQADAVAVRKLM